MKKRKYDREDARKITSHKSGYPVPENRDLRQLLWHRQRSVQMRKRIMNQLQASAMNEGYRWERRLFSEQGQALLEKLALAPWVSRRRQELLELLDRMNPTIEELTGAVGGKPGSDQYPASEREIFGEGFLIAKPPENALPNIDGYLATTALRARSQSKSLNE